MNKYLYYLPFIKNRIVIIDTEVTGITSVDNIIDLCAREMIDGKLTNNIFHSFFKPKKRVTADFMKKHQIPNEVLNYTYEYEKKIFEDFLYFVGNSLIISHNALYDMEKINNELKYYNLPLFDKYQFRCSMRIFKERFKYFSNKFCQLKQCCLFLEIEYDKAQLHLAEYDSLLLGKVLEIIYTGAYKIFKKEKRFLGQE